MKLSTKGRYGLKVMFDLALHNSDSPVSLTDISERQKISVSYLEQLMILLRKNGLVISSRGALGGYRLSKRPEEITVGEILIALEGSLAPTDCSESEHEVECIPRSVYSKIYEGIRHVVDNLTLHDMKTEYYADYMVEEIVPMHGYIRE